MPSISFSVNSFLYHVFLFLLAKLRAASTEPKPHFFSASAFLVGLPFESFIGPFIPANLAAKETLRGFVPLDTGAFKLAPSFLLKYFLPAAVNPPVLTQVFFS
jgi:hypothetical protein